VLALGGVGDLLERSAGLLAHDPPALSSELTDAAEVLFVIIFELLRIPHVGTVDHESVRGTSYVLFVATATTTVRRGAGVIVVEDDVQRRAVLDDILQTWVESVDRVHATVRCLRRRASTYARVHCR
jgi:hypothetical protein